MPAPVDICAASCHQVTGTVSVKKADILILKSCKKACPQVHQHILGSGFQRNDHSVAHRLPKELEAEHGHQNTDQRLRIPRNNNLVHKSCGKCRIDQKHKRSDSADGKGYNMSGAILPVHYGPEPFDLMHKKPPHASPFSREGIIHLYCRHFNRKNISLSIIFRWTSTSVSVHPLFLCFNSVFIFINPESSVPIIKFGLRHNKAIFRHMKPDLSPVQNQ